VTLHPEVWADRSRLLTLIHLVLLGLMVSSLAAVATLRSTVLDAATPIVFWLWLTTAPFVGTAALILSGRRAERGRTLLNGVLLCVWAVGAAGVFLLH
jgi:hypothetical protein